MTRLNYLLTILYCSCVPAMAGVVDTRVGTAASETRTAGLFGRNTEELGQTLPAVLEPNGMNFWTPQTQDTERKCKAPYYYRHDRLQGFRNSHWIVGGCTQDYGSVTLMPLSGKLRCQPQARASRFSHDDEVATPSYYKVNLPDEAVTAEMTGRSRSAIFRFTYAEGGDAWLVVNPNSDEGMGYIEVDTARREIRGYNPVHRIYQGKGQEAGFSGYFVIRWADRQPTDWGVFHDETTYPGQKDIGGTDRIGAYVKFSMDRGGRLLVKAASSFCDMAGAQANLDAEIPHWQFDRTRGELADIWNRRFGLIEVESPERADSAKFYGAMYRASFLPRTFNDVDGRYPAFSGRGVIKRMPEGKTYYEDFSMWDTYRALHPLVNLLTPEQGGEMMQSLVLKAGQGGWLPIFPCWNSYTAAMIGDHCISAIGDAYIKGARNIDMQEAYKYMRKNAFESPESYSEYADGMGRRALKSYLDMGYIPLEDSVKEAYHKCEQTSRTLEYAYDDFVLAQVADRLGCSADYRTLMKRAGNWRNVIDPRTGYAQGRHADGSWLADGNAFGFARFITEGAPCHYTWYVPHDPYGLMERMGGRRAYVEKLDSMFTCGRYWHGNEPCHQVAWMYGYAGEPWKTQLRVRHIMETEYFDSPGGLSGNDDAGQMSAWYMFAAMGFYPVCPGTPYYMIGSPSFRRVTLNLENGRSFTIVAENASADNVYVQSVRLNGKPYDRNYLTHDDIMSGGVMEFVMGDEPNKEWGSSPVSLPPSFF